MKKCYVLLILLFQISAYGYAHTLEESIEGVNKNILDTSQLIIKYKSVAEKELFYAWGTLANSEIKTENLVSNDDPSDTHEVLGSYQIVNFNAPLILDKAVEVLKDVYSQSNVEFAIFAPLMAEAILEETQKSKKPLSSDPMETPDFEDKQTYLNSAPEGIDARYAWGFDGGAGKNVKIMDMETGINADHKDFAPLYFLSPLPRGKVDHGTAVRGEMVAKRDGKGVTGIVYQAGYGFFSRLVDNNGAFSTNIYHSNMAKNLVKAIEKMERGDVLVLEMHSYGPKSAFIPVEYWQPVFDILKVATHEKGIHCVAAAGNGHEDLDDPAYGGKFDPSERNSGCVLVGAAESTGISIRKKANFSNFGKRIDAYGYGRGVVTAGYGDLHNSPNEKYTARFSGTSSATPIVGGAMASVASRAEELGVEVTPLQLQEALRLTGTAQQGDQKQRIGNLPDLKALYSHFNLDILTIN